MKRFRVEPDRYETLLLTDPIRDEKRMRKLRAQQHHGWYELQPILVTESDRYNGLLVIDGNHRGRVMGDAGITVYGFLIENDEDACQVKELESERRIQPIIRPSYLSLFADQRISLEELTNRGDNHHLMMGKATLHTYLNRQQV